MAPPNPLPLDAANCVLYGFIRTAKGLPKVGASVLISSPVTWPEPGFLVDTGVAVGEGEADEDQEVLTNASGYWQMELRRGRLVRVRCPLLKLDVAQRIPDANNQDIYFWGFQPTIADSRQFVSDPVNYPANIDTSILIKIDGIVLPQVMDLYDQIRVYRSTTRNGVYAEQTTPATRIELVDQQTVYEFTQLLVNPGQWYKAALYNSTYAQTGPQSAPYKADAPDYAVVGTIDELKDFYLFGANLTDDAGRPYPRSQYEWYLRSAIGWMERELMVSLKPKAQVERQDFQFSDYLQYGYLQLDCKPVLSVDTVEFMLGSQALFTVPNSWLAIDNETGVVRVVPTQGALANVFLSASGQYVGPGIIMYQTNFPQFFRITYRHGFGLGQIPPEIKDMIMKRASLGPLNIAGELLIGAGIASTSTSAGGVSQSIGTTSSAENAGYGARVKQYRDEIKEVMPGLKRQWRGIQAVIV